MMTKRFDTNRNSPLLWPRLVAWLAWLLLIGLELNLEAQDRHKGAPTMLATDVVFLENKSTLYGIIDQVTQDEVTLVIERAWLKANHPDIYERLAKTEGDTAEKANADLIRRIDQWIAERKDEVDLKIFLEDEKKLALQKADSKDPHAVRFAFLKLPQSEIRRVVQQSSQQRKVALVSWKHDLPNVAVRPAQDLVKELKQRNIDWQNSKIDFSGDVVSPSQTDREWAFRKALVEFSMMPSLEFQGTGNSFFRRGEKPGMKAMMEMVMGQMGGVGSIQQIGEELGLPEFTNRGKQNNVRSLAKDSWKKQIDIAEKEGLLCFSITQLKQNPLSDRVEVKVMLIAKDERGRWQKFKEFVGRADANKQSDADVKAMSEDPQVKQIMEVTDALGMGASPQLKRALRHGVATQAAMQAGLNQLAIFVNDHSKGLAGPRIITPGQ